MNDNADFIHLTVSLLNAAAHRVQKIAYLLGAHSKERSKNYLGNFEEQWRV